VAAVGQSLTIPAVTLRVLRDSLVTRPEGSVYPGQASASNFFTALRTAQSQFKMTPQPNTTQTLADRRLHAHEDTASCSRRQAYSGHHSVTASPNIACWNVRRLSLDNDCDSHSPRKSALIDLDLARLNIDICALNETWLTGTGSIREDH